MRSDSSAPRMNALLRYHKDACGRELNAVVVDQWHGTALLIDYEILFLSNGLCERRCRPLRCTSALASRNSHQYSSPTKLAGRPRDATRAPFRVHPPLRRADNEDEMQMSYASRATEEERREA